MYLLKKRPKSLQMKFKVTYYQKKEERINVISHALGVVLSVIAFPFLVYKACKTEEPLVILSFVIYGGMNRPDEEGSQRVGQRASQRISSEENQLGVGRSAAEGRLT